MNNKFEELYKNIIKQNTDSEETEEITPQEVQSDTEEVEETSEQETNEQEEPEQSKDKPLKYPREVTRRRGLEKQDERHIIIKQLENAGDKHSTMHELSIAINKIKKLNQKLAAGKTVTVEERKFIKALKDII